MAITIARQVNVAIVPGVAAEVMPARASRLAASIQVQADGFAWVSLGGTAAVGTGMRIRGWQIVDLGVLVDSFTSDAVNFYEGGVSVLWEGGAVDRRVDPEPQASANVRVIEAT